MTIGLVRCAVYARSSTSSGSLVKSAVLSATIVSFVESSRNVVGFCNHEIVQEPASDEFGSMRCWRLSKNRFVAERGGYGDNLSVRLHIQNSISLTIAMLPRII
jgi:hypothetical protein